jgi:hypothetical protein
MPQIHNILVTQYLVDGEHEYTIHSLDTVEDIDDVTLTIERARVMAFYEGDYMRAIKDCSIRVLTQDEYNVLFKFI